MLSLRLIQDHESDNNACQTSTLHPNVLLRWTCSWPLPAGRESLHNPESYWETRNKILGNRGRTNLSPEKGLSHRSRPQNCFTFHLPFPIMPRYKAHYIPAKSGRNPTLNPGSTSTVFFGSSGSTFGGPFGSFASATPAPLPGNILSGSKPASDTASIHNTGFDLGAGRVSKSFQVRCIS